MRCFLDHTPCNDDIFGQGQTKKELMADLKQEMISGKISVK